MNIRNLVSGSLVALRVYHDKGNGEYFTSTFNDLPTHLFVIVERLSSDARVTGGQKYLTLQGIVNLYQSDVNNCSLNKVVL